MPLGATVTVPAIASADVRLNFTDDHQRGVPTHVLFRGLAPTHDPTPKLVGRGFSAARSVYLLDGVGEVALAPGRYHVTASHGLRYSLFDQEISVAADQAIDVTGTLREVVLTPNDVSGDFHLHAIPSPDSRVTLPERIGALYCEGVDFAVATDHNHVTDYVPAVTSLGIGDAISTLSGEEVTTFSPQWGHFNAYPMPLGGARTASIVPFYGTTPDRVFAAARERGARVIQLNHPRLLPAMGYFNFTHFDGATGRADPTFATDFNAIEVFNGWQIEQPARVRSVLQDFVGLVRRGLRPTPTGNSDSHYLLYEEAGYPRTYVHTPRDPVSARAEGVVDGMLHGRTTVSSGPFVEFDVQGQGPGAIVRPDRGMVHVHVRVSAPAWVPVENIEVWVDDRVVRQFAISAPATDGVRFEQTVDLPVTTDALVLVWADAQTPLPDVLPYPHAIGLGFTAPVYIDADGDGRIQVGPRPVTALKHPPNARHSNVEAPHVERPIATPGAVAREERRQLGFGHASPIHL